MEIRNRKPPTNQDRLFLSLSQCGFRDGQPLVCCRETAPPPPVTQPPPPSNRQSLLPRPGECGIDADDRIYGGNKTKVDEFPWMVLLQYSKRMFILKHSKTFFSLFILLNIQQITRKVFIVVVC